MSGIIHFVSGKTLEITDKEFRDMPITLTGKGIKVKRLSSGSLVPMNSTTMEFIEHVSEVEVNILNKPVAKEAMKKTTEAVEVAVEEMGENAMGSTKARTPKEEKPKHKTDEEIMADMMAKSNCTHPPEKLELYIQHTAKGIRYFPVCSFCGKRERYVSESKITKVEYVGTPNEKWTEADIANAKPWIDK